MVLGLAMVGAGTAGVVSTIRGQADAGPVGNWLRDRIGPGAGPSSDEAGFDASTPAGSIAIEDTSFSFKGKIYTGATVKSRLAALFWLVLIIGVVALVIAASLFAAGTIL